MNILATKQGQNDREDEEGSSSQDTAKNPQKDNQKENKDHNDKNRL
jgi:hypothetical protein